MSPKPKPYLRRLGYIEMYQSGMHNLNYYCSTITTCRYTVPPSLTHKQLTRKFDEAVARTVVQFPLLQVGLVGEGTKKPVWVALDTIDLADHITWDIRPDSTDYDEFFEANLKYQLDTKFDHLETKPGWRLLLMRPLTGNFVDVMFVWNHSNIDGMGSKIFHRTLLSNLSQSEGTSPLIPGSRTMNTDVSKETFPQPQEKLAKHKVTMGFAVSEIWHNFGPSAFLSSTAKARWAPISPTPYITRNKCIEVDKLTLKNLLGLCRQHDTTLTGLLHGIVLACLSVHLSEGKANAFNVATSMDQRRFMTEENRRSKSASLDPSTSVQNCVSSIYHTFGREIVSDMRAVARINNWPQQPILDLEPYIWRAAQTIRDDIEDRVSLGLTNTVVGLMKLVTDWQEYHRTAIKKPRELSWDVTNLGVIDGGENGWGVEKARFSLCADVAGPAMMINVVSVKGGGLTVEISWQGLEELDDVGERLGEDVKAWLMRLGA
ncbi:Alcohol acetyltransferase [Fusarium equiseti]|uniref:Alcohol acetyltransferase n=1 Tax=Fusarium equiseti TaxID=61235 RepID=A0ABQ8R8I8_FUSEQ|nr:Alcohol acetyltransferase [Fusarium equiseti]